MIDTRQEMLIALAEAAELEHNLACSYLFAAFTIKDDLNFDGLTQVELDKLIDWQATLLDIAKQEMGHLGTVSNLISSIGGSAHFRRANFPQPARYYPPNIDFVLERFGLHSLARFIEFERPEIAPPFEILLVAPDPLTYTRVGDLYRQIRQGFENIDEAQLFINADAPQDTRNWSFSVPVYKVLNRGDALQAIDKIIVQGEGTPDGTGDSHYERFRSIALALMQLHQEKPDFDPARNVASNPQTRKSRDAKEGTLITDPFSKEVGELFNVLYGLLLRMLAQYYAFAGETDSQRLTLRRVTMNMMVFAITPLGVGLTKLPLMSSSSDTKAGPGFELYGDETLSTRPRVSWDIFIERLNVLATQSDQLAIPSGPIQDVLKQLASDLRRMRDDLIGVKPN